jgi:hypothetical protein
MSKAVPWDDIKTPEADYNVRLIAGTGTVPCYWGKDIYDRCLFLVELHGAHSHQFAKDRVVLNGIAVDLRKGDQAGTERLVLSLEKHVDCDLFHGLCETLVTSLVPVTSSSGALAVALNHLKRWKAFLAGRAARILTPDEIRGLFAELVFLRELYQKKLAAAAAIEAWTGPDRVHQDFVFGDRAVEIKSVSGKDRSTVRISSEDQLESAARSLFLRTYRLNDLVEAQGAMSLNAAVQRIEHEVDDAAAIEGFATKLAACGYAPLPEYDTPKLSVIGTRSYAVAEGFPRLIRSKLPTGIAKVSYQIELEAIEPFKCPPNAVLEG